MTAPTPPKSSIQITPQLLMMVLLVLLMLALPLTVAAWFLVSHFRESRADLAAPAPPPVLNDTALRQSFETVAETAWADLAKPLELPSEDRIRVPLEDSNPENRQSQILTEIGPLGGTAVIFPPDEAGNHRMLVTLPSEKMDSFLRDLTGSPTSTRSGEESSFIEITIAAPTQP